MSVESDKGKNGLAYSFFSLYLSLSLTSNILIATVNVNGLSVSVKGQRSPE